MNLLCVLPSLTAELAKYKDLNHAGDFAKVLFASNSQFQEVRDRPDGVGRDTLVKFLGGNWTSHKVRIALDLIKDKELDQQAIETIPSARFDTFFRVQYHNTLSHNIAFLAHY